MSHQINTDGGSKSNNYDEFGWSTKKLSVLIVDDVDLIRKMHKMILNGFGPHVETHLAENGKAAVEICRSGKHFDIVFMDRDMPVMNGIQATRELREMGVTSRIVGVTACTADHELKPFMEAGLNECFEKPLTVQKAKSVIDKLNKDG